MQHNNFNNYNLSDNILSALKAMKYTMPTKVQEEVMPLLLEDMDVVVKSRTGSGKTAAFAVPICEKLVWEENKPQALVLAPTRELAVQIGEVFFNIGRNKRIKTGLLYGRSSFDMQRKLIKQKTHVVVATPGRLLDHIERGTVDLSNIKYLIIDEADEMFHMGFLVQVESIINSLPKDRVTAMFSATFPREIEALKEKYMNNACFIEISAENQQHTHIKEYGYECTKNEKMGLLKDILITENPDSAIIFCNTKDEVQSLYMSLINDGYHCDKISGDMEQRQRLQVMEDFKRGYFRYLIATDIAARGIDVAHITHVINYDIPEDKEKYVHRIGRTGRADSYGKSISLITPDSKLYVKAIESYIDRKIPIEMRPEAQKVEEAKPAFMEKMPTRMQLDNKVDNAINEGIMKIHINAGKKTKMRAVDIVGTLCNIEGMTAEDIGIINILDVSTFVEIMNGKGEHVLEVLQTKPIKGRLRRVSRADI